MSNYKKYLKNLNESSLSRLYKHMTEHDTGIVTAYRSRRDCSLGEKYTKKENQQRNKSLLAKLQAKRYNVTSLKGAYIENYGTPKSIEVGEHVFFVVDTNDNNNLLKDLQKWGTEFDQDSILYIPKGSTISELHGTNKCPNGYPGWKVIKKNKERIMGEKGEFFSRVRGRPFVFKENLECEEQILPEGLMGRWACKLVANTHWRDIEI